MDKTVLPFHHWLEGLPPLMQAIIIRMMEKKIGNISLTRPCPCCGSWPEIPKISSKVFVESMKFKGSQ